MTPLILMIALGGIDDLPRNCLSICPLYIYIYYKYNGSSAQNLTKALGMHILRLSGVTSNICVTATSMSYAGVKGSTPE